MNQEQWRKQAYDEWVGRTTGTRNNIDQARGDDARRLAEIARQRSLNVPSVPASARAGTRPATRLSSIPQTKSHNAPWFPFVDRWLAAVPRWVPLTLALVGALFGYGASSAGEHSALGYSVLGGLGGFLLLPLIGLALKLALAASVVAALGALLYGLFTAAAG